MDFSKKINELREELGFPNRNTFAKALGIPYAQLYRYEKGEQKPGRKFIERIKKIYPEFNEAFFFDEFKSFTYAAGSKEDYEQQIRKLQADIKRLEEENRILRENLAKIAVITQTLEVSKKIKNKPKS